MLMRRNHKNETFLEMKMFIIQDTNIGAPPQLCSKGKDESQSKHEAKFINWGKKELTMSTTEDSKAKANAAVAAAAEAKSNDDGDSDVELEGMDLEGLDEDGDEEDKASNADDGADEEVAAAAEDDDKATSKLETEDHDETEAARKEQMELMAAESAQVQEPEDHSVESRLQYLLSKSEVFAHFLAGSVAATSGKKGGKKGKSGRGKKGRMTEAEEDAQMLKSAQSKRRVIRLDKQPSILADHCKMHPYQLEGLNWLIKLHCNGINGILADEVCGIKLRRAHTNAAFADRLFSPFATNVSNMYICCRAGCVADGIRQNLTNYFLVGISS